MLLALTLLVLTVGLAYANGANDVANGIATLAGAGVSNYRVAIAWGSICTLAGAAAAGFASQSLAATFGGSGLLADPGLSPVFLFAVAAGSVAWLLIATATGLPVSTTHALGGALVGTALVASGVEGVLWPEVAKKVAVPLLVSPFLAILLVLGVAPALRPLGRRFSRYCLCIEEGTGSLATPGGIALRQTAPVIAAGEAATCATPVVRLGVVDALHWISAGATSFFRGMNDAPKILAVGVAAAGSVGASSATLYAVVAAAMGAGSVAGGLRVTRTLAEKVTPMTPVEGLAANAVTSTLVGFATQLALPVSTTHVSAGAVIGAGVARGGRGVRWKTAGGMVMAWIVTVPVSAICAAIVFWLSVRAS